MLSSQEQQWIIRQLVDGKGRQVDPSQLDRFYAACYKAIVDRPAEERKFALADHLSPLADGNDHYQAIIHCPAPEAAPLISYKELSETLEPVAWFWRGWIPRGLLSVLAAPPGAGKSLVALDLARRVAAALTCPDGSPIGADSDRVIYVDAESVPQINVERARRWEIPLQNIYPLLPAPYGIIDLGNLEDKDRLIEMSNRLQPGLIIVDSLSMISSKGDGSVEEVRPLMTFLAALAQDVDCALILIHHTRKRMQGVLPGMEMSQDDLRGSGHIIASARTILGLSVIQTGPEADRNGPRRLEVLKTNLGAYPKAIGLEFVAQGEGVIVRYGDAPNPFKSPTQADECAQWLAETLQQAGEPVKPQQLVDEASAHGWSRRTLYRAREQLGDQIEETEGHRSPGNAWTWSGSNVTEP